MKDSKIISFIAALIVAIGLWIYVVTVVNPDGETLISDIPVVFSGEEVLQEDQNLIIADGRDASVSVQFSGKNTELKKLLQARSEISAVVDVTNVRSAKEYTLTYDVSLPSGVSESEITISDRRPARITFSVERLVTRQIPVKGDFSGLEVADGYMLESTTFDFDTVTVKGPEQEVSAIETALVTVSRTNLNRSFVQDVPYTLVDADGNAVDMTNLTTDTDTLELSASVVMYKEVPLDVTFINGGGATDSDVTYTITPETVTLSGDATILDSVNKIVLGNIDLSTTPNSKDFPMSILLPDGVKNVSGEEEATVSVRIKNRETAVVRATNITFINTDERLDYSSVTQLIQVTVRASAAEIEKISTNNLRVVADMADFTQVGKVNVPVEIYVDGYADAGVVGEYSVVVSITEKE